MLIDPCQASSWCVRQHRDRPRMPRPPTHVVPLWACPCDAPTLPSHTCCAHVVPATCAGTGGQGAGKEQGPQAVTIFSTLLSMMGVVKQEVRTQGFRGPFRVFNVFLWVGGGRYVSVSKKMKWVLCLLLLP